MFRPLFNRLSPAGAHALLSVLVFHRVLPRPDPLFPTAMHARRFDAVCGWLARWFNVLALDEAVARLKAGTLPARAASISFDDGYADNHQVALPILQRHGLSATFFIATSFLDGGRMWNDSLIESIRACKLPLLDLSALGLGLHRLDTLPERRSAVTALITQIKYRPLPVRVRLTEQLSALARVALPHDLMLTSPAVKALRQAGMQIGAHTVSHPILAGLPDEQARQEISGSQQFLETLLGERVSLFAYPNGKPGEDYTPHTVDIVRSLGFEAAVSTQWGASGGGDDLLQLKRFTPWDQTRLRFGLRMLSNLKNADSRGFDPQDKS